MRAIRRIPPNINMVSRVLASDGTFAKGFLDSRPTANFEQNFDRAGRGMLRTLLRVAGRANLDRRDACRLRGSENHIDDGDATIADPAARNCCRALIAGSPYPTSALPDLVSAAKCYLLWKNTTDVQFFLFFHFASRRFGTSKNLVTPGRFTVISTIKSRRYIL